VRVEEGFSPPGVEIGMNVGVGGGKTPPGVEIRMNVGVGGGKTPPGVEFGVNEGGEGLFLPPGIEIRVNEGPGVEIRMNECAGGVVPPPGRNHRCRRNSSSCRNQGEQQLEGSSLLLHVKIKGHRSGGGVIFSTVSRCCVVK